MVEIEFSNRKIVTRALVKDIDGRVLLGKRARGVATGEWALVGGKPDSRETLEETIVREVREELGVKFIPRRMWGSEIDKTSVTGQSWDVYYFEGEIEGAMNLNEHEITDVAFIGIDEIENYKIAFDHVEIINKFLTGGKINNK
ncbi:MAG: ADP-ribose pyrophosphatase [Candidatus Woesebacteria bacterium GW2011_GWA1_37_8]|uniref:ADP-ribose pyrophosphatase n=2 Tax=Candidatus Woeseibacteriota TaxID=1752722 RepID=A0A0G0L6N9_9BACT|nr:MAG: ADP-ribose pyrophosphatase [Microgenomates group bacterium GW2011_GWC1_37_12b]KKQ45774.1 MAG: ADP-ribose pyrophosphatase [Candidatus Woesebacteria bacterium GW2011_GWA1_37_8]KKQ86662.1 MAG: ADP-ribose pyrophosphatase [Candidatus Woesebacteria bacterium GW2011_GWB1_38_8b]